MENVSSETNDKLLKRVLPHGFMPSVPGSVVGVGLCACLPAAIMCPLVVSGNAFDLSGFCGNPGVTRGHSVASISALSIRTGSGGRVCGMSAGLRPRFTVERQGCEETRYHIKGCCFEGFKLKLTYFFSSFSKF